MDVARINRSHGDTEVHKKVYDNVRAAAQASGRSVAVLVDLQGPKIRLGRFIEGKHDLAVGDTFTITTDDVEGTKERVSTTHKGLPNDARVGDPILIDDGKVLVRVTAVEGPDVVTRVEVPGPVSNNKGLNLPGVAVSVPAMSDKDEEDLRWALTHRRRHHRAVVRALAPTTTTDVRRIMEEENRVVPVIAKIEKPQAVENLAEIIAAFDGIMVARGDLGVELPLEQVPLVQKRAVELARRNAKPVIVATQVLESMTTNPRPTRAETSDCANAVLDGADAVMLSGETSVGDYPIETVRTMARIIEATEELGRERIAPLGSTPHTRGGAITRAAAEIGETLDVKYLVTFTQSGDSARRMSRLRSAHPAAGVHAESTTCATCCRSAGACRRTRCRRSRAPTRWSTRSTRRCARNGLAEIGDYVVVVAGAPGRRGRARRTRSSCTRSATRRTRAAASPDAPHVPIGPARTRAGADRRSAVRTGRIGGCPSDACTTTNPWPGQAELVRLAGTATDGRRELGRLAHGRRQRRGPQHRGLHVDEGRHVHLEHDGRAVRGHRDRAGPGERGVEEAAAQHRGPLDALDVPRQRALERQDVRPVDRDALVLELEDEELVGILREEHVPAAGHLHERHPLARERLLEHLRDATAALVGEVDVALVRDHRALLGVEEPAGAGEVDLEHPGVLQHEAAGFGGAFRVLHQGASHRSMLATALLLGAGPRQNCVGKVRTTPIVASSTTAPIAIIVVRRRGEPSLEPMPLKNSTDAHSTVAST